MADKRLTNLEVIEDTVEQHPTWSAKAVYNYVRKGRKRKVSMERVTAVHKTVHQRLRGSLEVESDDDFTIEEGDFDFEDPNTGSFAMDSPAERILYLLNTVKQFGTIQEAIEVLQAIVEE